MRVLTREELKLVAGGNSSSEIVVIGNPGGGGGGGGGGWGGGGGGWGGGDGGGGGGGGGSSGGGDVSVDVDVDPENNQADIIVTAQIGQDGLLSTTFDLTSLSFTSVSLTINDGSSNYTATIDVDTGSLNQTYNADFGGGITGSFSIGVGSNGYSGSASLTVQF